MASVLPALLIIAAALLNQPAVAHPLKIGSILTLTASSSTLAPLDVAFINASTGVVTAAGSVTFPINVTDGCRWRFGSSRQAASFFRNSSWFFLAQLECGNGAAAAASTHLFQVPGLQSFATTPSDIHEAMLIGSWNKTAVDAPLTDWSISWDHVCNVVVQVVLSGGLRHKTLMLSEYDRQVRPQATARFAAHTTRVTGLGAMTFTDKTVGGPYELNCGTDCLVFSLESSAVDEADGSHGRLVGRNFHTAEARVNVTLGASMDLRTLTYDPSAYPFSQRPQPASPRPFVGLAFVGRQGELALVAYDGTNEAPYVLTDIAIDAADDDGCLAALDLGVVLEHGGFYGQDQDKPLIARVWVGIGIGSHDGDGSPSPSDKQGEGRIISFQLARQEGTGRFKATSLGSVPVAAAHRPTFWRWQSWSALPATSAFASASFDSASVLVPCMTRSSCSDHGNCVNERCVCDANSGFYGPTCSAEAPGSGICTDTRCGGAAKICCEGSPALQKKDVCNGAVTCDSCCGWVQPPAPAPSLPSSSA